MSVRTYLQRKCKWKSQTESVSLFLSRCETERARGASLNRVIQCAYIYTLILISRCTLRLKYQASDIKVPSSGGGGGGSNKTHTRFHYANNSTQRRHTREVQRSRGNRHEPLCIFFSSKLDLFSERAHVGFLPVCIVHAVLIYTAGCLFVLANAERRPLFIVPPDDKLTLGREQEGEFLRWKRHSAIFSTNTALPVCA